MPLIAILTFQGKCDGTRMTRIKLSVQIRPIRVIRVLFCGWLFILKCK